MGWIKRAVRGLVSLDKPPWSSVATCAAEWGLVAGLVTFGASARSAVGSAPAALWGGTAVALFAGLPVFIRASKPDREPVDEDDTQDEYERLNPWRFARQPLAFAAFAIFAIFAGLAGLAAMLTFGHGHAVRIAIVVIVSAAIATGVGLAEVVFGTRKSRPHCVDYEKVRRQIEHEDDLVNHRVSWLMASQAFLFGAYALGYTTKGDTPAGLSHDPGVFQIIPIVALVAAFIIYLSVVAAVAALENLRISYLCNPRINSTTRALRAAASCSSSAS